LCDIERVYGCVCVHMEFLVFFFFLPEMVNKVEYMKCINAIKLDTWEST